MRPDRSSIRWALALPLLLAAPAGAEDVAGEARVIDGRTLEIAGRRFRLQGIDAPDLDQTCRWPNKVIPCGEIARTAMMDLVSGARVVCTASAERPAGAATARCRADGFDIGANMVHTGWALAHGPGSQGYAAQERRARAARRGLWNGAFAPPWEWRRDK